MRIFSLFFTILLVTTVEAKTAPYHLIPDASPSNPKLRILDAVELSFGEKNGMPFFGISDLAYDPETKTLFAVSDNGWLYRLHLEFDGNGKIGDVRLLETFSLRDEKGKPLRGKEWRDAEGLAFAPSGELLVSFERHPRVILYDRSGRFVETVEIPKPLRKKKNYRGKNKMLEAVVWHPLYGLVTVPEKPLKQSDTTYHTIFARNERWKVPATGSPTAIEVTRTNDLLLLERDFGPWERRIRLSLIRFHPKNGDYAVEVLADWRSSKGWNLDNFEGLTRIGKNRYLMISDDNGNPFQKTVLVLFEISE
ncbi:esterase-like activity of phytase family protein [Hydrogenimonas sp.]